MESLSMKNRSLHFLLFILVWGFHAVGGGSSSAGGGVVACRNQQGAIITAELLDFYEGRILREIIPDLGPSTLSPENKIDLVLKRIGLLDPPRAARYAKRTDYYWNNFHLVDAPLKKIEDEGELILEPECKVEQLAIRRKPEFPQDKPLFVNRQLWEAINSDGKAGLILHEVIYEEAMKQGYEDSKVARYFNSLVSSNNLEKLDVAAYEDLVLSLALADRTAYHGDNWVVFSPPNPLPYKDAETYCESHSSSFVPLMMALNEKTAASFLAEYVIGRYVWDMVMPPSEYRATKMSSSAEGESAAFDPSTPLAFICMRRY